MVGEEAVAVHEYALGANRQLVKGTMHGSDGCPQDVDAVNLLGRDHGHSPCQRLALDDGAQLFALTLSQLLAVVNQVIVEIGRQNDSSGRHRAGKATAARLVTASLDTSCYQIRL